MTQIESDSESDFTSFRREMFEKNRLFVRVNFLQRQIDTMSEQIKMMESEQLEIIMEYNERFGGIEYAV